MKAVIGFAKGLMSLPMPWPVWLGLLVAVNIVGPIYYFEALEAMGASHVLLDTFTGDIEATRHHEHYWQMLTVTAEQILELPTSR